MNFSNIIKQLTIFLFLIFCYIVSSNTAEAERALRIVKTKPRSQVKIHFVKPSSTYARRYSYGKPLVGFSTQGKSLRNKTFSRRRGGRPGTRNYAHSYRNWSPNRIPGLNRYNPRVDYSKRGPPQKLRPEPYPFVRQPQFGGLKQKRRARPQKPSSFQRPQPPKRFNNFEDDYYFFPDEGKIQDSKFEYDSSFLRSKKRRRNPSINDVEKFPKRSKVKFPGSEEEKPVYKPKNRNPVVSYSTFIQHPSIEDDYEDDEEAQTSQQAVSSKKKRVKKKTTTPTKKKNKDEDYSSPYAFEKEEKTENVKKTTKKQPYQTKEENETQKQSIYYQKAQIPSNAIYNEYRPGLALQASPQFSPTYTPQWSQAIQTTSNPPIIFKTENGFQPQYVPNPYYQNQVQKTQIITSAQPAYYSQPAFPSNQVNAQVITAGAQVPTSYSYATFNSPSQPSPAFQHTASTFNNDVVTVQKSVPVYDKTETLYNYNPNSYVNNLSSKYSDNSQKYSSRLSNTYKPVTDKTNENEFLKNHQNLYNKGLSGVPTQGDGYAKDSSKNDFDIGYGDFQFDENPTS